MAEIYAYDGSIALVDDAIFNVVASYKYSIGPSGALKRVNKANGRHVPLARDVWEHFYGITDKVVYIQNGDLLDCRISNLSLTVAAHMKTAMGARIRNAKPRGSSGLKGIHKPKRGGWTAAIYDTAKIRHLGSFPTPEAAARAYDQAAFATWGTDCYLNFPEDFGLPAREPKA